MVDNTSGINGYSLATGVTSLYFDPYFASTPNIIAVPSSENPIFLSVYEAGINGCSILTWDTSGNPIDCDFYVYVIGPHA